MRDKIAVFSGGWGGEYFQEVFHGITRYCNERDRDVYAFLNFTIHSDDKRVNIAEFNLLRLPDFKDFCGVIVLANSFNSEEELTFCMEEIKKSQVPAISIEYDMGDIPFISTDNYSGMYDLAEHIFKVHHAKNVVYIGGPKDHPESQERLRAVMDAASDVKVTIPQDHIFYAMWAKNLLPGIVEEWFQKNDSLPDAFICANDIMAIGLCEHLFTLGYSVPKDVIVTGYDCLKLAQTFNPPITSVSHEWSAMGELAAKRLFAAINGEGKDQQTMLKTRFICGESCGCTINKYKEMPMYTSPASMVKPMNPVDVDSHFRHFYATSRGICNQESFHNALSYMFQAGHQIEGDSFRLCVDPEYFNVDEELLLETECRDKYQVAVGLVNGKAQPMAYLSRRECLYGAAKEHIKASGYVVLPLYSETYTYGFAVLNGEMFIANDYQHYIWYKHMNQAMEIIRNNIRLDVLNKKLLRQSVTDALTGVYNRMGAESVIYPMLLAAGAEGKEGVVMLMDINRMKLINDKYGHASGDMAIKTAVSNLQKYLPSDYEIARFGGDEFFIGGVLKAGENRQNITRLIKQVEDGLAMYMQESDYEWPLTVSIGYQIMQFGSVTDIERGLNIADEEMYQVKKSYYDQQSKGDGC